MLLGFDSLKQTTDTSVFVYVPPFKSPAQTIYAQAHFVLDKIRWMWDIALEHFFYCATHLQKKQKMIREPFCIELTRIRPAMQNFFDSSKAQNFSSIMFCLNITPDYLLEKKNWQILQTYLFTSLQGNPLADKAFLLCWRKKIKFHQAPKVYCYPVEKQWTPAWQIKKPRLLSLLQRIKRTQIHTMKNLAYLYSLLCCRADSALIEKKKICALSKEGKAILAKKNKNN